jgi:hypothetical protein
MFFHITIFNLVEPEFLETNQEDIRMEDQTGEFTREVPETLVAVTLNGGRVIKDGSMPVEWWISDSVIKENPEYILLVEQDTDEKKSPKEERVGRRYLYEINKSICYLQLFSAGHHRFMAIVFQNFEKAKKFMKTEKDGSYSEKIYWPSEDENYPVERSLGQTVLEFEVLEEAFAKIPETRLRKIGWYWVNLWWGKGPKDECEYRKWVLPCIIFKPPVWLVINTAVRSAGVAHALYVLLASLVTLLAGFRPKPILNEMKDGFWYSRSGWSVVRYERWLCNGHSIYKLWSYKDCVPKYVFTTPAEIVGVLIVCKLIYWFVVTYSFATLSIGIGASAVAILVIMVLSVWIPDKYNEWKENKVLLRKKWMKKNLDISKQTDVVDLATAPLPLGVYGNLKQRWYRGFWALKSQVCKPYPKKR